MVGTAVGAHQLGTAGQITKWSDVARSSVVFIVFGAFLLSALGGWTAGKVAGIRRSEPAMLHGAITWLVALPLLLVLLDLGGGGPSVVGILNEVMREIGGVSALIVAGVREEETDPGSELVDQDARLDGASPFRPAAMTKAK